jgi:serine O-acetyltransferase
VKGQNPLQTAGPVDLIEPDLHSSVAPGDELWERLRQEAREALERSPQLAGLFVNCILEHSAFEVAVFCRIAARLKNDVVRSEVLMETARRALLADPSIGEAVRADIMAVIDRDPAADRLIEPFLYFKGFHAIQTQRIAHWLWENGERDFAFYLQSRSSEVFQTDIHPAVPFGRGIFLDHATGLVVGETAQVDDDVSMLQNVTLGGTGKAAGDRHPKVRRGVIIGAGAKILGNIEIGAFARIAAGSVVLQAVASRATVAGVPAKVIKKSSETGRRIEEALGDFSDGYLDYSI